MQDIGEENTLQAAGLNLLAVFDLSSLPQDILKALEKHEELGAYNQLILVGHGGRDLWKAMDAQGRSGADPIDSYSETVVSRFLEQSQHCRAFEFLYPGDTVGVGLTSLGALAGWHHASLLRIGINARWGTWFAYRALVLADSNFKPWVEVPGRHPCETCALKPCITACPAGAVSKGGFNHTACYDYRLADGSSCAAECLARKACPVAPEHQYSPGQMAYHYGRSLKSLRAYRTRGDI